MVYEKKLKPVLDLGQLDAHPVFDAIWKFQQVPIAA
jgi:hypothetical protein